MIVECKLYQYHNRIWDPLPEKHLYVNMLAFYGKNYTHPVKVSWFFSPTIPRVLNVVCECQELLHRHRTVRKLAHIYSSSHRGSVSCYHRSWLELRVGHSETRHSLHSAHARAQPTFSLVLSPGHAVGAVGASGEPEEAFWPSSLISNRSGARSTDDIGDLY